MKPKHRYGITTSLALFCVTTCRWNIAEILVR